MAPHGATRHNFQSIVFQEDILFCVEQTGQDLAASNPGKGRIDILCYFGVLFFSNFNLVKNLFYCNTLKIVSPGRSVKAMMKALALIEVR